MREELENIIKTAYYQNDDDAPIVSLVVAICEVAHSIDMLREVVEKRETEDADPFCRYCGVALGDKHLTGCPNRLDKPAEWESS